MVAKTETEQANTLDVMLTRVAAARSLGISPRTLDRHRRAGLIPFVMIGRSVKFRRSDIMSIQRLGVRVVD